MKTIGLIWGMSWRSSLEYYKIINETIQKKLWGRHSAKIIMYSVDFEEIDLEHNTEDWVISDNILINAAKTLENWWADFIVLCANTAHTLSDTIQKHIHIPLLHIADMTAEKIKAQNIHNIWLLGTKHTMQEDFYIWRLEKKYWLNVIVPEADERETVHKEINNLCLGKATNNSKQEFVKIINNLVAKWAEAVILWCTEIPLIIQQKDVIVPLFDTTRIHAESAADFSLS